MPSGPIRRGQLIAPFGVGAMTVNSDGISLIAAGLDHWYELESGSEQTPPQTGEFKVGEWRLERLLGVSHFRLPPDYRRRGLFRSIPNAQLTVPFLRFPRWHLCRNRSCNRMYEYPLSERGRIFCPHCAQKERGRFSRLFQVPLVAICDRGHIQDFPWREWAHRSVQPECEEQMQLISTGGGTLAGMRVRCECGEADRPLFPVMGADVENDTTELTEYLDKDGSRYYCRGLRPWLGNDEESPCGRPLRASQRGASNVYFAMVKSSVYLPRGSDTAPSELVSLFEKPPISTLISTLMGAVQGSNRSPEETYAMAAAAVHENHSGLVAGYSNAQIAAALRVLLGSDAAEGSPVEADDEETAFRRSEFNVLKNPRDERQLLIEKVEPSRFGTIVSEAFSRVMLVKRLRETRALVGFTRVFPESDQSQEELISMLRRDGPEHDDRWLPAYEVYGEGIFLEFNESRLDHWEEADGVRERVEPLDIRYGEVQARRKLRERSVSPRLVLVHTFAHLLMNRLVFECGYSSAALRERLYISGNGPHPMAGVLIYTAAGDAEGTMGGLVRMGKPGNLEPVINRALDGARWCSADPVCMEVGGAGGQGPDSCNLAACHNCALVPETACEEFNRFLDRGLVVGEPGNTQLGYFGDGS